MTKRASFDDVKTTFEERGYELLETTYMNGQTPMKYRCPNHPDKETKIRYSHLKNGVGLCRWCDYDNKRKQHQLPFEVVKQKFADRGYELLESSYVNNKQKLRYKCEKHQDRIQSIRLDLLQQGKGCRACSSRKEWDIEEAKKVFEEKGYTLLESVYTGFAVPMRFICPNHADIDTSMTIVSILSGQGCRYCAGNVKYEYDEVKSAFASKGYELLDVEYTRRNAPLRFRCPNHPDKETTLSFQGLSNGHGCKYCYIDKIKGSGSHYWKGGLKLLNEFLRDRTRDWKRNILEEHNFVCDVTGENYNKLVVHHSEPFHKIRDKVLKELRIKKKKRIGEYTDVQLEKILKRFIEEQDKIFGVPMKREIHWLFHSVYGLKATHWDYVLFKARYQSGEFRDGEAS